MSAQITDAAQALKFMLGGNSRTTLKSAKTGTRYTYKITAAKPEKTGTLDLFFVSLLTGADNESDYTYLGVISWREFKLTGKSRMSADSAPVKAFAWALAGLLAGVVPTGLEIWHEGRCGRCNHPLTVPASIESGFGPECITRM